MITIVIRGVMVGRLEWASSDVLVLTHSLEKLRMREGLTVARLETGQSADAAPLLDLAATRRFATVHVVELPQAALLVVGVRGSHGRGDSSLAPGTAASVELSV